MIEVHIMSKGGTHELGVIRITNMEESGDPEYGSYSVEFGVDTAAGFAIYQRSIYAFPRKRFNVLALLKQALETLDEKELSLDGDPDNQPCSPRDAGLSGYLARRLRRSL